MCFCPLETPLLMLLRQKRPFPAYISLQSTSGKSSLDRLGMQSREILPLKVGNVMCLGTGQSSGSKTNVVGGELAGATCFWLDIIVVFHFGMPVIDARHSTAVYMEFLGNGISSHPCVFEMDDASLFGG